MVKDNTKKINLYSIRYKNSMQPVDWKYYTKFYPNKPKAIQQLRLHTGLGLKEAKEVVDEIYLKVENGEVERRADNTVYSQAAYDKHAQMRREDMMTYSSQKREKVKKSGPTIGQGIGCGCFTILYIFFGTIFKVTSNYSKKRW